MSSAVMVLYLSGHVICVQVRNAGAYEPPPKPAYTAFSGASRTLAGGRHPAHRAQDVLVHQLAWSVCLTGRGNAFS